MFANLTLNSYKNLLLYISLLQYHKFNAVVTEKKLYVKIFI